MFKIIARMCMIDQRNQDMKTTIKQAALSASSILLPDNVQVLNSTKPPQNVVRLLNIRTGAEVSMGRTAAFMLSTRYPQEFKII